MVIDLAENFYPDVNYIEELSKGHQQSWIIFATGILRGYPDISQPVEAFSEAIGREVDAEINDILQRREADLAVQEKRLIAEEGERTKRELREQQKHKADLDSQEQDRLDRIQDRQERKERWEQEKTERETKRVNSSWKERISMGMATAVFICAVAVLIVGLLTRQGLVIGGSGVTGLAALYTMFRLFLLDQPQPHALLPASPEEGSASISS